MKRLFNYCEKQNRFLFSCCSKGLSAPHLLHQRCLRLAWIRPIRGRLPPLLEVKPLIQRESAFGCFGLPANVRLFRYLGITCNADSRK